MKFDLFNSNNVNFATGATGFSASSLGLRGGELDTSKPFATAGFQNFIDGMYTVDVQVGMMTVSYDSPRGGSRTDNLSTGISVADWISGINALTNFYGSTFSYDSSTDKFTLTVTSQNITLTDYAPPASWVDLIKIPAGTYTTGTYTSSSAVLSSSSVSTTTGAHTLLQKADNAIATISSALSYIGSSVNRLTYQENSLTVSKVNTEAARGRIEDADMAYEQLNATKSQILQQTSNTMLAQANSSPQSILSLMQR